MKNIEILDIMKFTKFNWNQLIEDFSKIFPSGERRVLDFNTLYYYCNYKLLQKANFMRETSYKYN